MKKLYFRIYQTILRIASYFINWREPELLKGENSILNLPKVLNKKGINKLLIVTDSVIVSLNLMESLLKELKNNSIDYLIYDKTVPNPTIDNIEEAFDIYKKEECTAIIGFGGGSSIDCAKGIAAKVAVPKKEISQMKGLLKVRKKTPTLIAIPTTSGTGSEATVAAVITNSSTHEKYAINDPVLIPSIAVLDPVLTKGLPKNITSTTGMDALTHAIEAYIGKSNTKRTKMLSKEAVKLIFNYLPSAYSDGDNLEVRNKMQQASYYAGVSFTRAYVGYVHAIAHTLGGFYSTPHGLANAVILPYVLEAYGNSVYKQLAELYDFAELKYNAQEESEKAKCLINHIKQMNKMMNIPSSIKGININDIPTMVDRAYSEANPTYPVPRIMSKEELKNIYYLIMEDNNNE